MYKKTITYTDYNGQERKEDFYFNIEQSEVVELEVGEAGGYCEMLKRIVNSKDGSVIMKTFKDFIHKSYGIKSPDGRYFDKSEEISNRFEHSPAYSVLFMELCTNTDSAVEFISRVLPLSDDQRKELNSKAVKTELIEQTVQNANPNS